MHLHTPFRIRRLGAGYAVWVRTSFGWRAHSWHATLFQAAEALLQYGRLV